MHVLMVFMYHPVEKAGIGAEKADYATRFTPIHVAPADPPD